jgi:outer membrane protein assembly factor BamB
MRIFVYVTLSILMTAPARAADWPQWRGPTGQGVTDDVNLPVTWDVKTGENIAWKAPLPAGDVPYSSPIVRGGRVFITLAQNQTRGHQVLCFNQKDGKQLWATSVDPGPWTLTDLRAGYAASTPAADGERVYALFGSAVLTAIDYEGKIVWRKELENYAFDVGIGCSPILYGGALILQADMLKKQSSLIAFDPKTGEVRWQAKRPDVGFAHSTPTVVDVGGKPLMLVAASDALQGIDPSNGTVAWWCKAKGDTVSPVFADGVAYIDSGRGGPGFGVAVAGALAGDVTKSAVKWTIPKVPEAFGSPVVFGGRLYRLQGPGILKCHALADGSEVYSQRLEGATSGASPIVTSAGAIYFASGGKSYVVKAGPKFEQLAANNLDDANYASPAVSDGRLFIKGRKFLYCIGGAQ